MGSGARRDKSGPFQARVEPCAISRHTDAMSLTLSAQAIQAMLDAARIAHPLESCGLLLGSGHRIHTAVPATNVAPDPARHFEIDPGALIAAHRAARNGSGPDVAGYFHSHPNGLARPSATDTHRAARDGRIWAIVAASAITCWCDGPNGFEPLSYAVSEG